MTPFTTFTSSESWVCLPCCTIPIQLLGHIQGDAFLNEEWYEGPLPL